MLEVGKSCSILLAFQQIYHMLGLLDFLQDVTFEQHLPFWTILAKPTLQFVLTLWQWMILLVLTCH